MSELISGKEALIALANGERVEYSCDNYKDWKSADIADLQIRDFGGGHFEFRLKPQTVKITIEVPKPFEPKEGVDGYIIDLVVSPVIWDESDPETYRVGAWRTEEEIKQVVAALRSVFGKK